MPKLQIFKSAVDGLVTSLEKYPEVSYSHTFAEKQSSQFFRSLKFMLYVSNSASNIFTLS
jgi:hypothetical protein